ncbi:hypothetical protein [Chelativorans sp. AA-79]|uniref:hypothetical protein n=1 Tax=Chelativorans sp. AA-79 TaxID=3028735 RepID=UPI0023F9C9C7|nr:hypothetical protein [Chelativorans sp. AA-79]WEX09282.1 hypothetical protein PVE73_25195 [Chelativorans sp. AA-79]
MFILVVVAFLLVPLAQQPLAQGLQSEEAIDAIVGSDVKTEETTKENQVERILAAIENTRESAERVRKAFNVETLEIVFLPDLGEEGGEIEKAIEEHDEEIETLRDSIEGSAMFYHAIDSRQILLQDVVAVEFADNENVAIFVTGGER